MKDSLKIKIRKGKPSDMESFWKVFQNSVRSQFPEYSPKIKNIYLKRIFTKENLKKDIKTKTMDLFLAFANGHLAGYLLITAPYGGVSCIGWIAVEKRSQGKGIGRKLLRNYEEIAKRNGIHKIHDWIDKRNIEFYKKNGWILVGRVPQNYFGHDDWLFYKAIKKPRY